MMFTARGMQVLMHWAVSAHAGTAQRSEEHTSEIQSRGHIVCRLLCDAATSCVYSLSLLDALPILPAGWPDTGLLRIEAHAPGGTGLFLGRIGGAGARRWRADDVHSPRNASTDALGGVGTCRYRPVVFQVKVRAWQNAKLCAFILEPITPDLKLKTGLSTT